MQKKDLMLLREELFTSFISVLRMYAGPQSEDLAAPESRSA